MRYVAFLRGINVSGQKLIKMTELKQYFIEMGLKNVVTYIQSGNVIFDDETRDLASLKVFIEKYLHSKLGYEVIVILRSQQQIRDIIDSNPLINNTTGEKDKVYVTLLSEKPVSDCINLVKPFANDMEQVVQQNSEFYLSTPAYGNTKLSNTLLENKTKIKATTRNWATINKVLLL